MSVEVIDMGIITQDDSILASIKRTMPNSSIPEDYDVYDQELLTDINTELAILQQLGVGPLDTVFVVTGTGETWRDFVDDPELLSLIPQYVALRVKMIFDTSKSSTAVEQQKDKSKELEFRIMDAARRYQRRKEGS